MLKLAHNLAFSKNNLLNAKILQDIFLFSEKSIYCATVEYLLVYHFFTYIFWYYSFFL